MTMLGRSPEEARMITAIMGALYWYKYLQCDVHASELHEYFDQVVDSYEYKEPGFLEHTGICTKPGKKRFAKLDEILGSNLLSGAQVEWDKSSVPEPVIRFGPSAAFHLHHLLLDKYGVKFGDEAKLRESCEVAARWLKKRADRLSDSAR